MSEPTQTNIIEEAPDEKAIVERLARLLEPRTLEELADMLEKARRDTGFGKLTIVILKDRSVRFEVSQTY